MTETAAAAAEYAAAAAEVPPEAPISKAEFSRRRGVTPGRVSQWLAEGKIDGAAIEGEGPKARIVESIAVAQLRTRLDPHQRLGNGLTTRLNLDPPPAPPAQAPAPSLKPTASARPPEVDEVGEAIRREQLESLQRRNRREALEEAAAAGRLADAQAARQEMGRLAARMVTAFEGALAELAEAAAGKFVLPQRDVLHLLRTRYREIRARQSEAAQAELASVPELVETEIEIETEAA